MARFVLYTSPTDRSGSAGRLEGASGMGLPAVSQGSLPPSLRPTSFASWPFDFAGETQPRTEWILHRVDLTRAGSRQGGRPGRRARQRAIDQLAARDGRQDAVGRWASPTNHFRTTERLHAGWPATLRRSTCRAGAADRPALTAGGQAGRRPVPAESCVRACWRRELTSWPGEMG